MQKSIYHYENKKDKDSNNLILYIEVLLHEQIFSYGNSLKTEIQILQPIATYRLSCIRTYLGKNGKIWYLFIWQNVLSTYFAPRLDRQMKQTPANECMVLLINIINLYFDI
jgi:hypothetical protein